MDCFLCKHKGHVIRDCPGKRELNAIQIHKSSCDAEKHVNKLQEENDQLKETLEKMKGTRASDLNERERSKVEKIDTSVNVWPTESIQRRSGAQHAADDVKGQVSTGRHTDITGRGGVGHMQTRSGETLHKSRSESEGDEVSAIATYGTRKQVPGCRTENVEGDGTGCVSSTSL